MADGDDCRAQTKGESERFPHAELGQRLSALQPRLTSIARRFAPCPSTADDIVQNAFEKAWRRFEQFDGRARFSTWMHRIVVNEALMWLRTEQRRNRHQLDMAMGDIVFAAPPPEPSERLEKHEQAQQLRRGIAALPAPEQEVLTACVLDEVSYEDFCERTGIGAAAAKSRAFRARQRLRVILVEAS